MSPDFAKKLDKAIGILIQETLDGCINQCEECNLCDECAYKICEIINNPKSVPELQKLLGIKKGA